MDFDSVLLENEIAPLKNIYRLVLCLFSSGFTLEMYLSLLGLSVLVFNHQSLYPCLRLVSLW